MAFTDDSQLSDQGDQYEGLSDYGKQYIERVPEEHRAIVAEHLKGWDAGATRKFQEIHDQYKWTKDLNANPEYAQGAVGLARAIENNPFEVVKSLVEKGYLPKEQLQGLLGSEEGQQKLEELGIDDATQAKLDKYIESKVAPLQQGLQAAASYITNKETSERNNSEAAQLRATLEQENERHGGVLDPAAILGWMQNGMPLDKAIERNLAYVEKVTGRPRASFSMSGSGRPPNFAKNLASPETDDDTVRKAIAELL